MRPGPFAVALLLGLTTAAAAFVRADDKVEGDLAKLQGHWKATVGPNKDIPVDFELKGNDATFTFTNDQGEKIVLKGEVKVDDKAAPHKAIDFVNFKRPNGEDAQPNLAIYKLDGEALTVCTGGPGNPRPSEFKDGDGAQQHVIEFKKVKDDAK